MVSVGIDVAKDKHDCFILNSERDILADVLTIPNNMEGFFILLGKILECTSPQDKIKVRLEATGQQLQHSRISSWKRSTHLWIPCAQIPTVRVLALERQNQPGRCANNWGYAFARCRLKPLHRYSIPSAYLGTGRRNWRYWSGHSVHHGWSAFSNYNYSGHWLPNECHDSGRSGGFLGLIAHAGAPTELYFAILFLAIYFRPPPFAPGIDFYIWVLSCVFPKYCYDSFFLLYHKRQVK